MVATNGHRLARMGVKVEATGTPSADFIVPPAALTQVQRLFKDDDSLEVARSGNHLGFRAESTEIFTRLIEGTYPNYDQVIPRDNDKVAVIDLAGGTRRRIAYATLEGRLDRVAALLAARGLGPGDRMILCIGNRVEFLEVMFGAMRAGIVPVPVNTRLGGDVLDYIVENSGARGAVVEPAANAVLAEIVDRRERPVRAVAVGAQPGACLGQRPTERRVELR